jgi:hypothetical protein
MTFLWRTAGLVLVVCAISLAVAAQDDAGPGAASKILAMETAWDRAMESKDIKVLDAIFDNGLVYVEYDGTLLTKAELLAQIRTGDTHPQQIVTQPMTVRVFGSAAIVIAYYHEKGIEHGKPYERRGRFIDTWVFRNGRWVCVAAQTTLLLR